MGLASSLGTDPRSPKGQPRTPCSESQQTYRCESFKGCAQTNSAFCRLELGISALLPLSVLCIQLSVSEHLTLLHPSKLLRFYLLPGVPCPALHSAFVSALHIMNHILLCPVSVLYLLVSGHGSHVLNISYASATSIALYKQQVLKN